MKIEINQEVIQSSTSMVATTGVPFRRSFSKEFNIKE